MEQHKRPLVTLRMLTYNHERYIAQAIKGALNQTYSPLEIIISDDASTDKTWEVILKHTEKYKGPHKVIINRNITNLGVANHLDKIQKISNGLISVGAAGDDISDPERVEKIVEEFNKDNWSKKSYFSNAYIMDAFDNVSKLYFHDRPMFYQSVIDLINDHKSLKRNLFPNDIWQLGATSAFHRDLYESFKKVNNKSLQDDGVYAFRALLLGGIGYIEKPLVYYRKHSESISSLGSVNSIKFFMTRQKYYKLNQLVDAKTVAESNEQLIRIMTLRYKLSVIKSVIFSLPFFASLYFILRNLKNKYQIAK
ncbi:MAG: glycosyltransferase [Brumimicrobium sp.]|nr:glycosyltransferase [Brumimicrobium sp.]